MSNKCPKCGSMNIIGYGIRKNIYRKTKKIKCKDCKYIHSDIDPEMWKKKIPQHIREEAIKINTEGISTRKVCKLIFSKYQIKISYSSVLIWGSKQRNNKNQAISKEKIPEKDDDWMYKPILRTNTKANNDGNKIEWEHMGE